jgi:uncharacterized protein YjbJ (UPF0337 family)
MYAAGCIGGHSHTTGAIRMNNDIIQGKWTQLKGSIKAKWNKLTDDDLGRMEGNREYLVGRLQERYGWQKDQAERELRDFETNLDKQRAA